MKERDGDRETDRGRDVEVALLMIILKVACLIRWNAAYIVDRVESLG